MRHRRLGPWIGAALLVALAFTACGSPGGQGVATKGESETDVEPVDVAQAQATPDGHTLNLLVNGCSKGGTATATETAETVTVDVRSTRIPLPCTTEILVVTLDAPLGTRTVVNARDGAVIRSYTADPPTTAPPPPPADCSSESIRGAVEREIDGGLRTRTLGCQANWMVVDTSTDACPATGEPMAAGCRANHHVVYFENVSGSWKVSAFDHCEALRKYPDFPAELCG